MSLNYNLEAKFQQAIQDDLRVVGEDLGDTAQFYSERGFPILGETQEEIDAKLLRDAEFEARKHFNPDQYGRARTNTAKDKELNLKTGKLRERLEGAIYEEVLSYEGRGLTPSAASKLEEGIRNIKAQYLVTRITMENVPKDPAAKHPFILNSGSPVIRETPDAFNLLWTIDSKHVVAMKIRQGGQEREICLYRAFTKIENATEVDWEISNAFAGIEFPLKQVARHKDKKDKWIFNYLPKIPFLVAILKDQKLRARSEELCDIFDNIREQHLDMIEQETTLPYIPLSADDMILYNDEVENGFYEPDFWEQELKPHIGSLTLTEWSRTITNLIINAVDPIRVGDGEAIHPMKMIAGKCWNGRTKQRVPLHKSVKQTLFWLMGSLRSGKRGFISHPGLTREDRETLIICARGWWDVINKKKNAPETSEIKPQETFAPLPILEDATIGFESLLAFMRHQIEMESLEISAKIYESER